MYPGLGLRLSSRFSNSFELSLGGQLGRAVLSGSVGQQPVAVQLTTISLLAGVLYAVSFGDFTPSAGLGARFGMAYFSALTPAPGLAADSAHNAWGGPAGMLGLRYRVLSQLHVVVAFEVGVLALTTNAVASSEAVLKLERVWLGASLGLSWAV
ncbi:MAG TPA: hypothetical protein VJV78_14115 [Polyangiales bacterium]|nr:hypothetical protein [Polyangiales bacterium]